MLRTPAAWKPAGPTLERERDCLGQTYFANFPTELIERVTFALSIAGRVGQDDPTYRKGIAYLMRTQAPDGSWHVKTRAIWLQPYFESGFPYGRDQFISTAGTAWASMALATVTAPRETTLQQP